MTHLTRIQLADHLGMSVENVRSIVSKYRVDSVGWARSKRGHPARTYDLESVVTAMRFHRRHAFERQPSRPTEASLDALMSVVSRVDLEHVPALKRWLEA